MMQRSQDRLEPVVNRRRARRTSLAVIGLATALLTACAADTPKSAASPASVRLVRAPEAIQLIAQAGTVVLDVRSPAEYAAGHVAGARNIDINGNNFRRDIKALSRDASYVVYCKSGNRSAAATKVMADEGFTKVADAGGLGALTDAGAALATG